MSQRPVKKQQEEQTEAPPQESVPKVRFVNPAKLREERQKRQEEEAKLNPNKQSTELIENCPIDLSRISTDVRKTIEEAKKHDLYVFFDAADNSFHIYFKEKKYLVVAPVPLDFNANIAGDLTYLKNLLKPNIDYPPIIIFSKDSTKVKTIEFNPLNTVRLANNTEVTVYELIKDAEKQGYQVYIKSHDVIGKTTEFQICKVEKTADNKAVKRDIGESFILNRRQENYHQERDKSIALKLLPLLHKNQAKNVEITDKPVKYQMGRVLNPDLDILMDNMWRQDYELWIKGTKDDGRITVFGFVDKGNAESNDRRPIFVNKQFELPTSDSGEVDPAEIMEKINETLEKDHEYQRRTKLTATMIPIFQQGDIHELVRKSVSPTECFLSSGDELKCGLVLFHIIKNDLPEAERGKVGQSRMALLHSLQRIYTHNEEYFNQLSPEQLRLFTLELSKMIITLNQTLAKQIFLDKNTKLIVLLGSEDQFQKKIFEEIANNFGITKENLKVFKGSEKDAEENQKIKDEFLKEVTAAAQNKSEHAVIWTFGHGSPQTVSMGRNAKKNEGYLFVKELKNALVAGQLEVNNDHLSIVLDQCYSHDMGINLFNELVNGQINNGKEVYPGKIVTASIRGSVAWSMMDTSELLDLIKTNYPQRAKGDHVMTYAGLYDLDATKRLDYSERRWPYRISPIDNKKYYPGNDITVFYNRSDDINHLMRDVVNRVNKRLIAENKKDLLEVPKNKKEQLFLIEVTENSLEVH